MPYNRGTLSLMKSKTLNLIHFICYTGSVYQQVEVDYRIGIVFDGNEANDHTTEKWFGFFSARNESLKKKKAHCKW